MCKLLSAEALLANPNTKPVMGEVSFVPVKGGKGKIGKMYEVICPVEEVPIALAGSLPRKPKIICDEFGRLAINRQRRDVTGGEISNLTAAWLAR